MKIVLKMSWILLFFSQLSQASIVCGGWDSQNVPNVFSITQTSIKDARGFISVNLEKVDPFKLKDTLAGDGASKTPFPECAKGILSGYSGGHRTSDLSRDLLISCVEHSNDLQIILSKKDAQNYTGKLFRSSKALSTRSNVLEERVLNCSVH